MSETITGGCHCGKVRWEAQAPMDTVLECNCSHCARKGFVLTFLPREGFTLLSGEDALSEYKFNRHAIAHLFCATCGVQSHGLGTMPGAGEMAAINLRCADNVDLSTLTIRQVDGKSL